MGVAQKKEQRKEEPVTQLLITTSLNFTLEIYQTLERQVENLNKNLPPIPTKSDISKKVADGEVTLTEAMSMLKNRPTKVTKRTVIEDALTEYFNNHGIEIKVN